MNTLTKRGIRLSVMTVGLVGLLVAFNAVPGAATSPSTGFASVRLGHGTLSHGSLAIKSGLEIVVVKNTIQPGASSGWHSHPGGAIVVIQEGQLTTYRAVRSDDTEEGRGANASHCVITTYTAGQAFVERPAEPLIAVNNGSSVTTSYATFPGVPVDPATGNTLQRTDQPKPNQDPCPF